MPTLHHSVMITELLSLSVCEMFMVGDVIRCACSSEQRGSMQTNQSLYVVRYLLSVLGSDVTVLEVADRTSESRGNCVTAVVNCHLQTALYTHQPH